MNHNNGVNLIIFLKQKLETFDKIVFQISFSVPTEDSTVMLNSSFNNIYNRS